jgi:hypothetical protein
MPTYTYSQLKADINGNIHNKMGLLSNPRNTINRAVRDARAIGIRSAIRRATSPANLFNGVFEYSWPADADGNMVVGIQPQTGERENDGGYELTTEEEFDLYKNSKSNLLSFSHNSLTTKLLASVLVDDLSLIVGGLDSTTGDEGTWSAFGNASNVAQDTYDFVKGYASLKFDLTSGGTTAGVANSDIRDYNLTEYKSNGSVFVWVYISATTGITNAIIRLGSDSSNYYSMTATTTNSGAAFSVGWNLIRFDFTGKTTTGTPVDATCDYAAVYFTKDSGQTGTSFRFDHIILKRGKIHNVIYYSRYMWQNTSGTYLENSTSDTDYLNCETDEYDLFVEKGTEYAAREAREYDDHKLAQQNFDRLGKVYKKRNPTEALVITNTMHNF